MTMALQFTMTEVWVGSWLLGGMGKYLSDREYNIMDRFMLTQRKLTDSCAYSIIVWLEVNSDNRR
jgi:hypothetical protein